MKKLKIAFLGAGSGFILSVARELGKNPFFEDCELAMTDPLPDRLDIALKTVAELFSSPECINRNIRISASGENVSALDGADYVISSCEPKRYPNWYRDLAIPEQFGCFQVKGENGGPGGVIHALRNMTMFENIARDMKKWCPEALLLNFTNPMSFLCTYMKNYTNVKTIGFCHQVHGSFGVISEMLGYEPDELEVVSAGINHLNWLFDIRRKSSRESCMKEFIEKISTSKYWNEPQEVISSQVFTLEVLKTFRMYPIGYDDHIIEYMPFFWEKAEWTEHGVEALTEEYHALAEKGNHSLEIQRLWGKEIEKPEFPRDPDHSYYAENPCKVIEALEKNIPAYFDAINICNHGAVGNLPADVILDVPGIAVGGEVRSIHVGELPPGPLEICRRQTALHEMLAQAFHERDGNLVEQIFCLTPYVRSITQARQIWRAYYEEYKDYLPDFHFIG